MPSELPAKMVAWNRSENGEGVSLTQTYGRSILQQGGTRWETARIQEVLLPLEQWEGMNDREAFIPLNEALLLLVVEVVSASTIAMDYRTKYAEYAVLDIPEYWIVDAIESQVSVCTLSEGFYGNQVFGGDRAIVSPTFSGLNLTAAQALKASR